MRHELDVLRSDRSADWDRIGKLEDYTSLGLKATEADWKAVKSLIKPATLKMH